MKVFFVIFIASLCLQAFGQSSVYPNFYGQTIEDVCGKTRQYVQRPPPSNIWEIRNDYKWPWLVSLHYRGVLYCAGALLSSKYAITAARCVNGFTKDEIKIRFGHTSLELRDDQQLGDIHKITIHPHTRTDERRERRNDLAIIEIVQAVNLGVSPPVCLPDADLNLDYKNVSVLLYPTVYDGLTYLHEYTMNIVPNDRCRCHFPFHSKYNNDAPALSPERICAENKDQDKIYDSVIEGPVMVMENGIFKLAGMSSLALDFSRDGVFVMTRVSSYLPWIKKVTYL